MNHCLIKILRRHQTQYVRKCLKRKNVILDRLALFDQLHTKDNLKNASHIFNGRYVKCMRVKNLVYSRLKTSSSVNWLIFIRKKCNFITYTIQINIIFQKTINNLDIFFFKFMSLKTLTYKSWYGTTYKNRISYRRCIYYVYFVLIKFFYETFYNLL